MAVTVPTDVYIDDPVATSYANAAFVHNMELLAAATGVIALDPTSSARLAPGGEFLNVPIIQNISSLITRMDETSTAEVTPLKLEAGLNNKGVVLRRKAGPVAIGEMAELMSPALTTGQLSQAVGEMIGREMARKVKLDAYVAAKASVQAVKLDVVGGTETSNRHISDIFVEAGTATMTMARLLAGLELAGDAFRKVMAVVMHSHTAFDLFGDQLSNYQMENVAGDLIRGGIFNFFGKRIVIDDECPTDEDVSSSGSPTRYWTFLFGQNAMTLAYQRNLIVRSDGDRPALTREQVVTNVRGDAHYVIHPAYMKWNSATANPNAATFATSTNWEEAYNDHREMGIFAIKHN